MPPQIRSPCLWSLQNRRPSRQGSLVACRRNVPSRHSGEASNSRFVLPPRSARQPRLEIDSADKRPVNWQLRSGSNSRAVTEIYALTPFACHAERSEASRCYGHPFPLSLSKGASRLLPPTAVAGHSHGRLEIASRKSPAAGEIKCRRQPALPMPPAAAVAAEPSNRNRAAESPGQGKTGKGSEGDFDRASLEDRPPRLLH